MESESRTVVGCPTCARDGIECTGPPAVPRITVRHLVRPEHLEDLPDGAFYFCPKRDCATVYFDNTGHEIRKEHLSTRVWHKETARDAPVCYCFSFSAQDIIDDAGKHQVPNIPLEIRDKIREGLCACETKNPRGICCLGDVGYWVHQM